jgi:hypothetical protein
MSTHMEDNNQQEQLRRAEREHSRFATNIAGVGLGPLAAAAVRVRYRQYVGAIILTIIGIALLDCGG